VYDAKESQAANEARAKVEDSWKCTSAHFENVLNI